VKFKNNKKNKKQLPNTRIAVNAWVFLFFKFLNFKSNSITTNKNNTAIAPTYTTMKIKAKNSHPSTNKKLAENKKLKTNHKREYMGLLTKTTKLELITTPTLITKYKFKISVISI
jgi:hypothetical protein